MLREVGAPAPAASREPQERSRFPPRVVERRVARLLRLASRFLRHAPRAARVLLAAPVMFFRLPRVLRLASQMMLAARVLLCRQTAPLDQPVCFDFCVCARRPTDRPWR